jgi:hypothetical protein
MDELVAYREDLLTALDSVVTDLSKTVAAISPDEWQLPYELGTHTPHYTLTHLREFEAHVFGPLLRGIVDEDTPILLLFDDNAWMASHYEPGKPAQVILDEFIYLRSQESKWLRTLPPVAWSRTARHPWWGVHTLQWWVELQLDYSHQHIAELATFLNM